MKNVFVTRPERVVFHFPEVQLSRQKRIHSPPTAIHSEAFPRGTKH